MNEESFNENQKDLFAVLNYIVIHSGCTPTEAIEVLETQKEIVKNSIANGT